MGAQTKTGAEWTQQGIRLERVCFGENLLINLPGRPGQGTDTEPPTVPGSAKKEQAVWIGHEGIGISWEASADNVMVSYYEIYKNGKPHTKVSSGTYFFDDAGVLADQYQVRAVDGDGNVSAFTPAV